MRKVVFGFVFLLMLPALASVSTLARQAESSKKQVNLEGKIKIAEGVYYLGKAKDINGKEVEGYAFVHSGKFAKPPKLPKSETSCYAYLANGAKWRSKESYMVDPTNTEGLSDSFVFEKLASGLSKWEDAADGVVGDGRILDIIGDRVSGEVDGADVDSPDNKNEILWGDVSSPGAIAMTIVWGVFSGPPQTRELVEWDQVYDQVDYDWSASETGIPGRMDFDNILTHEHGHALGMADLYQGSCSEETMYGYAEPGEIKKRDLNIGDIVGISKLY